MNSYIKNRKLIIGVIALVILVIVGVYFKNNERKSEVIKIGFIGPLSETNANIGEGIKNAIEMATEKINNRGNNNARVEIIYEDDQFNGRLGITAYHKLRDIDKVDAIINTTPATANAFQPLLKNDPNPLVVIQIATPEVIENDTIFQIIPTATVVYYKLGELASEKYKSVAFVYENGPAFEKAKDVFSEAFQKTSSQLETYRIDNIFADTKDYKSLIAKILDKNFDALTILSTPKVGVPFLKQFVQQNKGGKVKLLCNADLEITIGSYFESVDKSVFEGCYSSMLPSQLPESFKNEYVKKYGIEPLFAVDYAYDSLNILCATYNSDVQKWKDNLQGLNYNGVSGKIMFDDKGSREGQEAEIHIFKDGKFVKLEE